MTMGLCRTAAARRRGKSTECGDQCTSPTAKPSVSVRLAALDRAVARTFELDGWWERASGVHGARNGVRKAARTLAGKRNAKTGCQYGRKGADLSSRRTIRHARATGMRASHERKEHEVCWTTAAVAMRSAECTARIRGSGDSSFDSGFGVREKRRHLYVLRVRSDRQRCRRTRE